MDNTAPKPFVFVLMPFNPEFNDIYKLGIKPACNNAGAYAERVDEQIFTESIMERIYNQISKADIIVADMTGRNPNVFYETGYAHALGKIVILLTQKTDDIPFDLKHYPHIVYEGNIAEKLLPELEKKIRWVLENLKDSKVEFPHLPVYYIDGVELINHSTHYASIVEQPIAPRFMSVYLQFEIDVFNPIDKYIRVLIRDYAIKSTTSFAHDSKIRLPDDYYLYKLQPISPITPGNWEKLVVQFGIGKRDIVEEAMVNALTSGQLDLSRYDSTNFILVEYSDYEVREIPFNIKIGRG